MCRLTEHQASPTVALQWHSLARGMQWSRAQGVNPAPTHSVSTCAAALDGRMLAERRGPSARLAIARVTLPCQLLVRRCSAVLPRRTCRWLAKDAVPFHRDLELLSPVCGGHVSAWLLHS